MINLLDFHKDKKNMRIGSSSMTKIFYYIVMLGGGGNGGYAVQRITKMMHAFANVRSYLLIADPDTVEEKNTLRQPFIGTDIGLKKADVLAKRYGGTYGLKIGSFTDSYIESVEELEKLFSFTDYQHTDGQYIQKVLIGAVDNDYSRKVMNDYFQKTDDLIYIDAGVEGVFIPEGDKPIQEWTPEEVQEHLESGYSGQVVIGLKKRGEIVIPALYSVYPINAADSIPPSHNCGVEPYQPQRMISNEMAALQISTIVNELFSSNTILVNYVNFNARNGNCRPTYVEDIVGVDYSENGNVLVSVSGKNEQEGNEEHDEEDIEEDLNDEVLSEEDETDHM